MDREKSSKKTIINKKIVSLGVLDSINSSLFPDDDDCFFPEKKIDVNFSNEKKDIKKGFSSGLIESFFNENKNQVSNKSQKIEVCTDLPKAKKISAPFMLKFTYKSDFNIMSIHNEIVNLFSSQLGDLDLMKNDLNYLKNKNVDYLKIIEINKINSQIKYLEDFINEIESGKKWEKYINSAKSLLEEYYTLASDNSKGIVQIGYLEKEELDGDKEKNMKRLEVIEEYIDLAKEYIKIDCTWEGEISPCCLQCNKDFKDIFVDTETNLYICECGFVVENLDRETQYEKPGHMSSIAKAYNSRVSFEKAYSRYQGISFDPIPEKLCSQLDEYFTKNGFLSGEQVRALPLNSRGKKENTSIKLLQSALKLTNNSDYYTIIYTLTYTYWGCKPPDIAHLRDSIMEKYDRNQKVYEKNKSRKSCLNVYLHLYQLLIDSNYPCEIDDFKILTTEKSIRYHNQQFELIGIETGMKYTELT